jgi:hypothetical protein
MYAPLDGPSAQTTLTVTDATVQEIKSGGSALSERGVITVQPIDGNVFIYFGDETGAPSAATVIADGFIQYKRSKDTYEATDSQKVYILSTTGTVEVKIAERA